MDQLNSKEYAMIKEYKKTKNIEIATYFFNKFEPDLTRLIFSKINKKFSSVPFEKGDIFSFV
ncbi:MAG: hypothetical protein MJ233_00470 [Mycoplasmoidaceae bacterium]|nr:hypothetical protein [Mycoplasmoidaceae bacterium]